MYTKDSPAFGGFLDEERTSVNWKDPLREISWSRTDVEDKMTAACAIAELAGGSVSAVYREGNYDENVGNYEVEFSDGRRSSNGYEQSEFVGGWMDSHGKTITRYVHDRDPVTPRLVIDLEANRGRKRKMEEPAEETGFVEKYARVANDRDSSHRRKTAKIADEDYHTTTVQSPESLGNDGQSAGHSSTMSSSDSSNKEVSGRFVRSAMTSSHIPRRVEAQTEVDKAGGRFVRTSMRGLFPTNENKRSSPVQWSTNSSDSINCGSLGGLSPTEMLKLPRNAAVPIKSNSAHRVVNVYEGSSQSSETLKSNREQGRVKSQPVLSEVSLARGQSSLSTNGTETSISDVGLRNSIVPQHPLFTNRVDAEILQSSASEFRQTTPPSNNGIGQMVYVMTTNPENGLTQVSFLPDFRVSDNGTLHKSVYGYGNTGFPAVEPLNPRSEERKSEDMLWRNLEVSCERDLLDASRRRNEGFAQYAPYTEYALKPGSLHSGSIYNGYNAQIQSPEYLTVAISLERMTIQREMQQLQLPTAQTCGPNTGNSYKKHPVLNEIFHRTKNPVKDQLIGVGLSPPIWTRETNTRLIACQGDNEKKRIGLHRSKSLSPSMKSNVESGNFGSLQSIRTYYKTLGKTKPCSRLKTGTVERCVDSRQFNESIARGTDMPIDLSSRVRKREQTDLESIAKANNTTDRNIDCYGRRNSEISGGYVPQPRNARSPAPGTILLTPKGVLSERSGVDISESLLQVPSPSISQPSSGLSSPACMPDSHLPPKKRKMPNFLYPVVDSSSSPKQVLNVSTSQDVDKSPVWNHIPVSVEESLELKTKTQLEEKTELPERGVHPCHWLDNGLEDLEDIRWAVTPDEDGDLPLHIGVARGSESYIRKCVRIMSRLGASLDVYDSNRKTALQIAVITSQLNIVEILLRASASPNVLDRNGANSIHLAVKYGELDCLKSLLTQSNHALDLDARNYEGLTALHIAVISNQLEATRILLRVGASVNIADGKTGQTPLHYAAERNSQQMAKLLLVFGANPSRASYSGCTPAQLASAKSHLEMAKMLERSTFSLTNGGVTTRKNLHVKEQ